MKSQSKLPVCPICRHEVGAKEAQVSESGRMLRGATKVLHAFCVIDHPAFLHLVPEAKSAINKAARADRRQSFREAVLEVFDLRAQQDDFAEDVALILAEVGV